MKKKIKKKTCTKSPCASWALWKVSTLQIPVGVLKDDAFALTFDGRLQCRRRFKWKLKSLYFLIGEYEKCSFFSLHRRRLRRGFLFYENGVLRARISRTSGGRFLNAERRSRSRED